MPRTPKKALPRNFSGHGLLWRPGDTPAGHRARWGGFCGAEKERTFEGARMRSGAGTPWLFLRES